jgi:glutathione S-transferase
MPTLVDGEFVVWESLAINLYLADKYKGPLHAGAPEVRAQAAQWSIFAVLELESLARDLLDHRLNLAERAREASIAERSELLHQRPIGVIDAVLGDRMYLLGDNFTVADLNVASVLSWAKRGEMDFSPFPNVERWLELCFGRPAYLKLRERMMAELNS